MAVFENLPVEVLRRMYTQGYLTNIEMCRLATAMKNKMLQREFCKRKRNNRNRSPSSAKKNKKTVRKAPMKAKRPWLK